MNTIQDRYIVQNRHGLCRTFATLWEAMEWGCLAPGLDITIFDRMAHRGAVELCRKMKRSDGGVEFYPSGWRSTTDAK